jgi:hypothetical protein
MKLSKKQNAILALTCAAALVCAVFAGLAAAHDADSAAVGWAFAALFFGGSFKVCCHDFGVWG